MVQTNKRAQCVLEIKTLKGINIQISMQHKKNQWE